MPLTSDAITQSLMTYRSIGVPSLNGPAFVKFATGLGNGLALWAVGQPQNLALTGASAGTAGVGTVSSPTTTLTVVPKESIVLAALIGAGVAGPAAAGMATVVALGVAQAFTVNAKYQGVSAGVGSGVDTSFVTVANPASLTAILMGSFAGAFERTGFALGNWALGLATGITPMLLGSTGTGTVVGTPSTVAAAGVSTSVVV